MANTSTQDFLEFDQIREGVIILKNKGLRSVLMVSSLNFALKSNDEQAAILFQFQNFLNSLDFPCQIIIHSRRINITGYLDKLADLEKKEENELLQIQIADYRDFIEKIMKGGSIMQKTFYVVVPFSFMETKGTSKGKMPTAALTEDQFQRAKSQLMQRVEFVVLGLKACSLQAVPLNTMEVAELFWALHHPLEAERGYYPKIPPELVH